MSETTMRVAAIRDSVTDSAAGIPDAVDAVSKAAAALSDTSKDLCRVVRSSQTMQVVRPTAQK